VARIPRGVGLALAFVAVLGSACTSVQTVRTTTPSTSASPATPLITPGTRSTSAPLVSGTPVATFRVGPLSLISPSKGYGLVEFDTTGNSTAQQLVVSDNGGVTWQAASSTPLPAWATTLEFTDAEDGYAWGSGGLDVTHDGGTHWATSPGVGGGNGTVSPIGGNIWAISSSGVLETTTNGGTTWHRAVQPPGAPPTVLSRVSTSVAYVLACGQATASGTPVADLARTENGGQTWQLLPFPQGCSNGSAIWWFSPPTNCGWSSSANRGAI
jgi:hypothetical protein